MASTYSQYKIELVGTGEQAGTWGTTTNNNFGSATPGTYQGFEQAIGGRADVTMSGTTTLSLTNSNAAQDARALYLNLLGTLSGAADLVVPALQKSYLVKNGTTGGFAVTIKVIGQTGVSIPNGKTVWVYNNGTDIVTAVDFIPEIATTTVDATNIEVTNIKAKDGSAAVVITDSTGAVAVSTALTANGGVVFNDAGADVDFRVEGDTDANLLFVDASTDRVGIGTSSPGVKLAVSGTGTVSSRTIATDATGDASFFVQNDANNIAGPLIYGSTKAAYGALGSGEAAFYSNVACTLMSENLLKFAAGGNTEHMRIDTSGNVGIGTTSPSYPLHVIKNQAATTSISVDNNTGNAASHASLILHTGGASSGDPFVYFYNEITDWSIGCDNSDSDKFKISKSSTLGTNDYFNIDSSGNVGIGTSSPAARLHSETGLSSPALILQANTSASSSSGTGTTIRFRGNANAGSPWEIFRDNDVTGDLVVAQDATGTRTERARITSDGFFKASVDGTYLNAAGYHELRSNAGAITVTVSNTNASTPNGMFIYFSGATPNNTSQYFLYCQDSTTLRAEIRSNGGLANYSANNVNLSDERVKKDVENLGSQWNCIKEWNLVEFRYNEQADDAPKNCGVIAQQIQEHCPEVVQVFQEAKDAVEAKEAMLDEEGNIVEPAVEAQPAQEERIGVREQQMLWMAVKALQEAMERIETLEAKVAALEAK
jgi:hypothetical protein